MFTYLLTIPILAVSEFRSCVKVEMAVLTVLMFSVDVKQH